MTVIFLRGMNSLGVFYDAAAFGQHRLLRSGIPSTHGVDFYSRYYVPGLAPAQSFAANLTAAPLTDVQRDIAAITLNRWPHGYVFGEAQYQGKPAHQAASKRHGNIVIANADAAGKAYTDAAIDMAWRAVQELKAMGRA